MRHSQANPDKPSVTSQLVRQPSVDHSGGPDPRDLSIAQVAILAAIRSLHDVKQTATRQTIAEERAALFKTDPTTHALASDLATLCEHDLLDVDHTRFDSRYRLTVVGAGVLDETTAYLANHAGVATVTDPAWEESR